MIPELASFGLSFKPEEIKCMAMNESSLDENNLHVTDRVLGLLLCNSDQGVMIDISEHIKTINKLDVFISEMPLLGVKYMKTFISSVTRFQTIGIFSMFKFKNKFQFKERNKTHLFNFNLNLNLNKIRIVKILKLKLIKLSDLSL